MDYNKKNIHYKLPISNTDFLKHINNIEILSDTSSNISYDNFSDISYYNFSDISYDTSISSDNNSDVFYYIKNNIPLLDIHSIIHNKVFDNGIYIKNDNNENIKKNRKCSSFFLSIFKYF